jgi:hypothetical protein
MLAWMNAEQASKSSFARAGCHRGGIQPLPSKRGGITPWLPRRIPEKAEIYNKFARIAAALPVKATARSWRASARTLPRGSPPSHPRCAPCRTVGQPYRGRSTRAPNLTSCTGARWPVRPTTSTRRPRGLHPDGVSRRITTPLTPLASAGLADRAF